jgi:hypothetical protein
MALIYGLTQELGPFFLVAVIAHHTPNITSCYDTWWIYGLTQELGSVFLVAVIAHHTPNLTSCYGTSWINVGISAYHSVLVCGEHAFHGYQMKLRRCTVRVLVLLLHHEPHEGARSQDALRICFVELVNRSCLKWI